MVDLYSAAALPIANPSEFLFYILIPGLLLFTSFQKQLSSNKRQDYKSIFTDGLKVIMLGLLAFVITAIFLPYFSLEGIEEYLYFTSALKTRIIGTYTVLFSMMVLLASFLRTNSQIKNITRTTERKHPKISFLIQAVVGFLIIFVPYIVLAHLPLNLIISSDAQPVIVNTWGCTNDSMTIELQVVNYYDSDMVFRAYRERVGQDGLAGEITEIGKHIVPPHQYYNLTTKIQNLSFIYLKTNYGVYTVPLKCALETGYGQRY